MKFHYAGKYSGNPDDIPCLDHEPGAVQFKGAKDPKLHVLATLGTLGIASAAGDFYNVRNALRQVPKGGRIYQHKYDTFWYMPEK